MRRKTTLRQKRKGDGFLSGFFANLSERKKIRRLHLIRMILIVTANVNFVYAGTVSDPKKEGAYVGLENSISTGGISEGILDNLFFVTGTVRDAEGNTMAGVNVVVRGTTKGTVTDAEGKYSIDAEGSDWLIFSFIGYKTVEVQIGDRTVVDQMIEEDTKTLEAVVVNAGYYQTTEKDKMGSIVRVSDKEIKGQPVVSPLLALQGRVAGLEISPANGAAGAAPKIRVRGENSLRSDGGFPLYVIDGVMIDSRPMLSQSGLFSSGIDPLININPENIESIEVLKDADATAIYGSRGANGVILVTTKRGKSTGGGIHFDLGGYRGFGTIESKLDLLNTDQYMEMRKEAFKNANVTPSEYNFDMTQWDTTRYTDWQNELLGAHSNITDAQLGFSGGNSSFNFRVAGSYHKETSVLSEDFGYDRAGASVSFNYRSPNNRFMISVNSNYGVSNNRNLNVNSFVHAALTLPPNAPKLYLEDGSLNWEVIDYGAFKLSSFNNPMAEMLRVNSSRVSTLVANGSLSYELANNLFIKSNVGYTDASGDEILIDPISANPPTNIGYWSTGTSQFSVNSRRSWIVEPQISYLKKIGDHSIDALVGSTFQGSHDLWQAVYAYGYPADVLLRSRLGATSYYYVTDTDSEYRYTALFARFGYSWRGKYHAAFNGRRDGSSRFGPNSRFGNFGSLGVAWTFSNEAFAEALPALSFGKIRATYGTTGNDLIGDYKYYNLLKIGGDRYQNAITLLPDGLYNPDFNWEVTKKLDVSLELGFFDDRLSLQASWYKNRSSNQLVDYQLPSTTGFPSVLKNFAATVENRGWELSMHSQNVKLKNFSWNTSINITIPKNKLVSFPGIESSPYRATYKVGEPLSIQSRYVWKGVDPQTGAHRIQDFNGDGMLDVNDQRFGDPLAVKYYGGVSNTIRYKSFELTFLIQFTNRLGTKEYAISYPGLSSENQPVHVLNRWKNEGDVTDVAKFSTDFSLIYDYNNVMFSSYNTASASFVRLKTAMLSYSLPSFLIERAGVGQSTVFVQGQNLFTVTDFVGLDPETGARSLPPLRMISVGLQVKL